MVEIKSGAVTGRGRYHVKFLKGHGPFKEQLEQALHNVKGITSAKANPSTGNILVTFDPPYNHASVAAMIQKVLQRFLDHSATDPCSIEQCTEPEKTEKKSIDNPNATLRKKREEITAIQKQIEKEWHLISALETLNSFHSDREKGLSTVQARQNIDRYGLNLLEKQAARSELGILAEQFKSWPVGMLGVASAVSLATGGIADAVVILVVVGINAGIGYVTESQSERTIRSLEQLVKPTAEVLRDGDAKEIDAVNIADGDVIMLRPGSYVPADARLIETLNLTVDESALTGESLPVTKTANMLTSNADPHAGIPLADRLNMVYMGTLVTGGEAKAVVVATGSYTQIGKIQTLIGTTRPPLTPMERQLEKLSTQLALLSAVICGGVFLVGLFRGYGMLEMLKSSISLAVAAVPEGLPTVATTTLALGIRKMRQNKVLIRHLGAVETLGTAQAICLDKTGTLTQNSMTVTDVVAGTRAFDVDSRGQFIHKNSPVYPERIDELLRLLHVAVLCSESSVRQQDGRYVVEGSSTENALVYMAINGGVDPVELRRQYSVAKTIHRTEQRNYMITLHEAGDQGWLAAIKGSPTEVLQMCSHYIKDGMKLELDDATRKAVMLENEQMAGKALRVLGFAYGYIKSESRLGKQHIWLGLGGMADPIRSGVKEVISDFHTAGIDTIMITGDQSPTAYAIGKALNLSNGDKLNILDSAHLEEENAEVLAALSKQVNVFARVSPTHKLRIVQSLQSSGKVVAMTGDGINDSPALKAADIGVAMGRSGTDVAREVADVILEDDNLQTMIIAVKQGRTIYSNIRKSIHYLLSTNLSEIAVTFLAIVGGMGQPLSAMQLLWINLMTDVAPSLALAMEPPEPDVLRQKPRGPDEPIVKPSDFRRISFEGSIITAATLAAYGYGIGKYGIGPQARGLAFQSLTMAQILHSMSSRSAKHTVFSGTLPKNRHLKGAILGSIGIQSLTLLVPGLRNFLKIAPISFSDGAVLAAAAGVPLLINESSKTVVPLLESGKSTHKVKNEK